jgi:YD repeat-containing protein
MTANTNAQGSVIGYTVFDGVSRHFDNFNAAGVLQSETDETGNGITLTYSTSSTPTSIAPKSGLLITVTDPNGRQLHLIYNSSGNVSQVTQPDGGVLAYTYDLSNNLASVQYPDGKTKQYVYNESSLTGGSSLPNAMTGIIDEASSRYANTTYNNYGQATSSSFAGGAFTTQITYNSDGSSTVQYPLGQSVTLGFAWVNGFNRVSSVSAPCGSFCAQSSKARTYDSNSNPASYADFNGNVTTTTYDPYWLLNKKVEASGTSNQRTTNLTWNDTLRLPLSQTTSDASGTLVTSTQWVYNSLGQTLAKCDIDASNSAASGYSCSNSGTVPSGVRRWTYTYCTAIDSTQCPLIGLILTATGPRTDTTQTTSYSYYTSSSAANCGTPGAACYQAGDLRTVTDSQGHVTTIVSYDGAGRITRITDANGVNTDTTYTPPRLARLP